MSEQLDFLAVGDITTDAFIRLKDPHIHTRVDRHGRELCIAFGTKLPFEFVEVVRAVGNAPNAAVSAARLGLSAGLVTDIGDDDNGSECLATLQREKVGTSLVSVHAGIPTNYHYVLWFEDERTILVKHQKFPYKFPIISAAPKWLYLSSLGEHATAYHDELMRYLDANKEVRLTFQPGTFQMRLQRELFQRICRRAEIFVCNREEARKILGTDERDIKKLLDGVRALGPAITLITDGVAGAYALDTSGGRTEFWFQPPFPDPKPPLNRTGAGDAFASTFTAAIVLGKTAEEALQWAPVNSAFVVQQIGAQRGLLTRAELEKQLKGAPADYQPQKI